MRRWAVGVPLVAVGVALLGALMWWLLWEVAPSLYPEDSAPYTEQGARAQAANGRLQAIATTRAAMVAGLAGLAAVAVAMTNALNVRIAQRTLALEREGHVTDRYSKAIEQLGDDKSVAIRLGGIYALERIAEDSERDHQTAVEVLSAFVREQTRDEQGARAREGSTTSGGRAGSAERPRPAAQPGPNPPRRSDRSAP